MSRLPLALLLLVLGGCTLSVADETTAPVDEEGEEPLNVTPSAPVAPQPSAVRSALQVGAERTVEPRNPTPDPWKEIPAAKPTPDPWSPEETADDEGAE
jgi:hypothetical protein